MVHSPQHFITLTQLCKCALTACLPTLLFLRRTCQCRESIKIRALLIVKIVFRTDMRALKTFCVILFAFVFLIRCVSMEVNTFVLKILLCIKIKIEFTEVWEQSIFVLFFITGIIGSAVLKYITPKEKRGTLGATVPGPGVTAGQAVGIEILLTFLLVFTVCASTDPKRNHYGYEVPLSIGLCVAVCHFIGVSGRMVSSYRLI